MRYETMALTKQGWKSDLGVTELNILCETDYLTNLKKFIDFCLFGSQSNKCHINVILNMIFYHINVTFLTNCDFSKYLSCS